jgi:hypothetical protein
MLDKCWKMEPRSLSQRQLMPLATLDRVHNQALKVITGGVKTSPVAAMEHYSNVEPLNKRREKAADTLHENLFDWTHPGTEILLPA